MNSISKLFLGLAFVSTGAFAADLAPVLKSLRVTEVGSYGQVVKSRHQHPFSNFLISIPVKVEEGSACTNFVGQTTVELKAPKALTQLTAVGASDPGVDACIEIYPMPIDTKLTVDMKVLTGGFVPAANTQTMLVNIASSGTYKLVLDMGSEKVKISKVK